MGIAAPPRSTALLDDIQGTFELSNTALGRLFGVSRQATDRWRSRGVPHGHQEKAAGIAAIGELLSHRLRPERIPGIARRPAEAYGGLTMLEMIERDRHLELLGEIRRSFDWATPA